MTAGTTCLSHLPVGQKSKCSTGHFSPSPTGVAKERTPPNNRFFSLSLSLFWQCIHQLQYSNLIWDARSGPEVFGEFRMLVETVHVISPCLTSHKALANSMLDLGVLQQLSFLTKCPDVIVNVSASLALIFYTIDNISLITLTSDIENFKLNSFRVSALINMANETPQSFSKINQDFFSIILSTEMY